ncbi:glycosyltransferase family 29 protein [Pseudaminobacter soli (ex Li et al. 2025)]|uniref:glycosyltransferase family 29 protein n=1 Tax=Pseudaminobacter soli (ex Li et al. 2025) TaxID=1295366 RepID=UPI001FDFFA3E|nr:glycosyltransferase family 29 protein [Mesorhizobium soli]
MVVVGNGPLSRDFSEHVDSADFVIRFNEPKAGIGLSGTKTDWLFMANSGNPMQRRLGDVGLLTSPIFRAAKEIIFPYHPLIIERYFEKLRLSSRLKGKRRDWTLPSIMTFGGADKEVRIMPPQFYERGCRALGLPADKMRVLFPSTGYFGIWHALERHPAKEWRVEVCGFTWQGWKSHAWADERRWIAERVQEGRIILIDEGADEGFPEAVLRLDPSQQEDRILT